MMVYNKEYSYMLNQLLYKLYFVFCLQMSTKKLHEIYKIKAVFKGNEYTKHSIYSINIYLFTLLYFVLQRLVEFYVLV